MAKQSDPFRQITEADFEGLSPEACIAVAARCALRVQPLVRPSRFLEADTERLPYFLAVDATIQLSILRSLGVETLQHVIITEVARAAEADAAPAFTAIAATTAKATRANDDARASAARAVEAAAYAAYVDARIRASNEVRTSAYRDIEYLKSQGHDSVPDLFEQPLWPEGEPDEWESVKGDWRRELLGLAADYPELEEIVTEYEKPPDADRAARRIENWWQKYGKEMQLEKPDETPPETPPRPIQIGAGLYTARDATDAQACLNVDKYAAAIADVLRTADGDFCFGLFGHWGRGKTFLVEQVAKRLEAASEPQPAEPKDSESKKQTPPRYKAVRFSAWAYPHAPLLWAHLYETLADAAMDAPWRVRLGRSLRTAIVRHGAWTLTLWFFLFAIGVGAAGLWTAAGPLLVGILGVGGAYHLAHVGKSGWRLWGKAGPQFLTVARHDEKLGLQAAIGKDLRSLIVGWLPRDNEGKWDTSFERETSESKWKVYRLAVLSVVLALLLWPALHMVLMYFGAQQASDIGYFVVDFALVVAAIAVFLAARRLPTIVRMYGIDSTCPDRILLYVDDLDRCEPEKMLEVMEGLKQFLESSAIQSRLQVIMLVDEDALAHAILEKYCGLIQFCGEARRKQIVMENVEKLFVAYLRLPELGENDCREVAEKFLDGLGVIIEEEEDIEEASESRASESEKPGTAEPQPLREDDDDAVVPGEETPDESKLADKELIALLPPRSPEIELHVDPLSPHEGRLLVESMAAMAANGVRPSPRAIRCFIFRYQLARHVLHQLGRPPKPQELIEALLAMDANPTEDTKEFGLLHVIAKQVSFHFSAAMAKQQPETEEGSEMALGDDGNASATG